MLLIAFFSHYFFGFTIFFSSIFLILLVLVQRGRGGGLTGALGGPGGQSAFGTKAGDLFTRITIGVAAGWIFLCGSAVFMLRESALPDTGGSVTSTLNPGGGAPSGMSGTTTPASSGTTETAAEITSDPDTTLGSEPPPAAATPAGDSPSATTTPEPKAN